MSAARSQTSASRWFHATLCLRRSRTIRTPVLVAYYGTLPVIRDTGKRIRARRDVDGNPYGQ
jgi:hypothetical protein